MSSTWTAPDFLSAEDLLGGPSVLQRSPCSPLDWVSVIRRGISVAAVETVVRTLRISQAELCTTLAIPERTLARRKREGALSTEESAKLVRLARVVQRAEEVFENLGAAVDWLKSTNVSLAGQTPLRLVDTEIGAELIMDTLGRIEQGVFA